MHKIYLDDVRSPKDSSWTVVRNYQEFVDKISEIGDLSLIDVISLDHDLGDTAMKEYFTNVSPNYTLDYNNIKEKTGLDCAKWLIDYCLDSNQMMPLTYTHSANPIGSANIMGYINNYRMNTRQKQTCVRVSIDHTV
jgi:hypothetical protein